MQSFRLRASLAGCRAISRACTQSARGKSKRLEQKRLFHARLASLAGPLAILPIFKIWQFFSKFGVQKVISACNLHVDSCIRSIHQRCANNRALHWSFFFGFLCPVMQCWNFRERVAGFFKIWRTERQVMTVRICHGLVYMDITFDLGTLSSSRLVRLKAEVVSFRTHQTRAWERT